MVKRRVIWAAAGVLLVLVAGVGVVLWRGAAPVSSVDEPFYATTELLEGRADVIVRGRIDLTRSATEDGITDTVATVEVRKTAKGDPAPGTSITVHYTPPGSGPESPTGLRPHGEYVLLLEIRPGNSWNLVNSNQGYYTIDSGQLTAAATNPVELSRPTRQALDLP